MFYYLSRVDQATIDREQAGLGNDDAMEVELDPLTLLEMGMGEDNIEIEVGMGIDMGEDNIKIVVRLGMGKDNIEIEVRMGMSEDSIEIEERTVMAHGRRQH